MSLNRTRALLTLAVAVPLVVVPMAAHQSSRVGRWAEAGGGAFVLHVEPDGTVRPFVPAPQFSATYRVDGARVVVTNRDGSTETFVLEGDTLVATGEVAFTRVQSGSNGRDKDSVRGTWAQTSPRLRLSFATFRTDGQLILEVSLPATATKFAGDMLKLLDKTYAVRETKDELYLEEGGKSRRFVRRPWGCFGTSFDGPAPECR